MRKRFLLCCLCQVTFVSADLLFVHCCPSSAIFAIEEAVIERNEWAGCGCGKKRKEEIPQLPPNEEVAS